MFLANIITKIRGASIPKKPFIIGGIVTASLSVSLAIGLATIYTVPANHVAVITHWGQPIAYVQPGDLYFKDPVSDRVAASYDMRVRLDGNDGSSFDIVTADGYHFDMYVTSQYRLLPESVPYYFTNIYDPDTVENEYLRSDVKKVTAKLSAAELLGDRGDIADQITTLLKSDLANNLHISLVSFQIRNLIPSDKWYANQAIAETSAANAIAIETVGKANADALAATASVLKTNPDLIPFKWDGRVPATILGDHIPLVTVPGTKTP